MIHQFSIDFSLIYNIVPKIAASLLNTYSFKAYSARARPSFFFDNEAVEFVLFDGILSTHRGGGVMVSCQNSKVVNVRPIA